MNKQKGCCGCFSIGCGGIVILLVIAGIFIWKVISPFTSTLKILMEDEVSNKVITSLLDTNKSFDASKMEIAQYLQENGYVWDINSDTIIITKPNTDYKLTIEGISSFSSSDMETLWDFVITLTKDNKTYILDSNDIVLVKD